jgi:hypothetical protein
VEQQAVESQNQGNQAHETILLTGKAFHCNEFDGAGRTARRRAALALFMPECQIRDLAPLNSIDYNAG